MKRLSVVGLVGAAGLMLSVSAVAATTGWNLGLQAGWDKYTNTSSGVATSGVTVSTKTTSGMGYGVFGGYNFNEYVGARLSLNKFSDLKVKDTGGKNGTIKYTDLDLMAMGYLPLDQGFDLIGGVGAAYVREASGGHYNFYRPKLLLGADWQLDENWTMEFSVSRIFGKGKLADLDNGDSHTQKKYLPDVNLVAVGVSYNF